MYSARRLVIGAALFSAVAVATPAQAFFDIWRNDEERKKEQLVEKVKEHIREQTRDPEAVRFRKVLVTYVDKVCGEFNAKNAYGGYTGYVRFLAFQTRDGEVVLIRERKDDPYYEWLLYTRCAPTLDEELARSKEWDQKKAKNKEKK